MNQIIENTKNSEKLHDLKNSLSRQKSISQSPQKKMEIIMIDNVLYHENMKKYQKPIINQNKKINTISSGKNNVKSTASVKKIIK